MSSVDERRQTPEKVPEIKDQMGLSKSSFDMIASMFDSFEGLNSVPTSKLKAASKAEMEALESEVKEKFESGTFESSVHTTERDSPLSSAGKESAVAPRSASRTVFGTAASSGGESEGQDVSPTTEEESADVERNAPVEAVDAESEFDFCEDETLDMPCALELRKAISSQSLENVSAETAKDGELIDKIFETHGGMGGVGAAKDVGRSDTLEKVPAETYQGVGGVVAANCGRMVASDKLPIGYVVKGRYRIESELGSGGFGVVYRAVDLEEMDRVVAVKTLRHKIDDYDAAVMRFKREIAICERLDNPHIVRVYDHGTTADDDPQQGVDADTLYYVMEFVEGKTLDDYIERREKFSYYDVKVLMTQVLDGLAVAHRDSIVHRDLKPANICLKPLSSEPRDFIVKLLDFGIARAIDGDDTAAQKVTKTGAWMGSPAYMSPEQLKGYAPTPASDIFAIGLIMIEMLTGVQAVNADSAMDAAMMILSAEPLEDEDWYWLRDTALWTVIEKCIQKDPTLRYQDASECLAALSAIDDNTLKNEYVSSKMRKRTRTAGRLSQATPSAVSPMPSFTEEMLSHQSFVSQRMVNASNKRTTLNIILFVFIIVGVFACITIFVVKKIVDEREAQTAVAVEELSERDKIILRSAAFGCMEGALPLFRMNVMVSSMPAGAEVYRESDDVLLGKTPLALSVIPMFNAWKLRLRAEGYLDYPFLVNVLMPTPVNLNMQRERIRKNGNNRDNGGLDPDGDNDLGLNAQGADLDEDDGKKEESRKDEDSAKTVEDHKETRRDSDKKSSEKSGRSSKKSTKKSPSKKPAKKEGLTVNWKVDAL